MQALTRLRSPGFDERIIPRFVVGHLQVAFEFPKW